MNDYDGYSESYIKGMIESQEKSIKHHQQSIDMSRDILEQAQAELDRRAAEAYWTAHPELERVAVGDKLLITQEFKDYKEELVHQYNWYDLNEVYEIQDIDGNDCYICSGSSVTGCSTSIVSNMRRAYLEQQQEAK